MKLIKVNHKYYPYRWWNPLCWGNVVKRFFIGFGQDFERSKYGVSTSNCWDLDYYMLSVFRNGLVIYKEEKNCYPYGITDKEWNNILDHMIHLIDIILEDTNSDAKEAFEMYWKSCGEDITRTGDEFLRSEWLRKDKEWYEYREDCRYEFYDLLKEWGSNLWW